MDTCVIYNSAAGRHRASERMRRFKDAWAGKVVFRPTERRGHAIELAREAALEGFATVAAAGGDGTAHEVASGLLSSQRTDVTFAVIPLGSANDYAHSVRHQFGAMSLREHCGNFLDVGLVRTPDGREFHFFESLGTGLSAQVTLESNATPWLQGRLLYGYAACRVLARMDGPTQFSISENGCAAETCPTLLVCVMLGRREGGFVLRRRRGSTMACLTSSTPGASIGGKRSGCCSAARAAEFRGVIRKSAFRNVARFTFGRKRP